MRRSDILQQNVDFSQPNETVRLMVNQQDGMGHHIVIPPAVARPSRSRDIKKTDCIKDACHLFN
jgi:hypothetical protein